LECPLDSLEEVAMSLPRFASLWECDAVVEGALTIEHVSQRLEMAAAELRKLADAGVTLERRVEDGEAVLTTDDADVARRFGLTDDWPD
jgi:hypothetical protein